MSERRNFRSKGRPGLARTCLYFIGGRFNDTELIRPFISERGWALYSAYSGFYVSRVTKASMLLIPSIDHAEIWRRINERDLVKASAPTEILELYDANILEGTTAFLKYLKDEMIGEFKMELSGMRDSESAVSNAAVMLEAAENLVQSSTTRQSIVPKDKPLGQPK